MNDNAVLKGLFKNAYNREMTEDEINNFYELKDGFVNRIYEIAGIIKSLNTRFLTQSEIDTFNSALPKEKELAIHLIYTEGLDEEGVYKYFFNISKLDKREELIIPRRYVDMSKDNYADYYEVYVAIQYKAMYEKLNKNEFCRKRII